MNIPNCLILSLALLISCAQKQPNSNIPEAVKPIDSFDVSNQTTLPTTFDSTLTPFSDTTYKLSLHIFDTKEYNQEKNNATVTFTRVQEGTTKSIFHDSLYCMYPSIERQDLNNDKTKDILIFNYTGARANPTYYLYLVDTLHHRLTHVMGFENLPNPSLDSINNIITSLALSGTNYYGFYSINSNGKLIDLQHSFSADLNDSIKYDKAIRAILRERRR